jgi:hypothetical protein
MAATRRFGVRRPLVAALGTLLVLCAPGSAFASPAFDEQGYSLCTATSGVGPDGDLDAVATKCCADHGGIPTPSRYGMGCVAQVDNPPEDYRPTIIMPTWPHPGDDLDDPAMDELAKQPPLPPPPGPPPTG